MKCTDCALELNEDVRFCPHCGQAATMQSAPVGVGALSATPAVLANAMIHAKNAVSSSHPEAAGKDAGADLEDEVETAEGGKVMTSPFPPLPATSAALPGTNVNGQMVHALLAQANLHRMRRQWEEAVECCVTVLRAQPANQSAHILLGDVYRDQRKLDDAIQWYGMALELRPNPTDQAKLDQALRERDRFARYEALRARRGYGDTSPSPIDRDTDLHTGTVNLMGISPRRWLRGVTATSLAFIVLVLVGLIWQKWNMTNLAPVGKSGATAHYSASANAVGLPPHRLDKTLPPHLVAQAANGDKTLVVGGAGLPPDQPSRTATAPVKTPAAASASSAALPTNGALPGGFGGARGAAAPSGMAMTPNLPAASVQDVRPLPSAGDTGGSQVAAPAPPSNRLSDGLQLTQTSGDGGINATVLLTSVPAIALDGSPRGQEVLVRNAYRAARTAFAGNTLLMRVRVMVQTPVQGTGLAAVMEAEVDRATAMSANPDRDDAATLQSRLLSYRWTGASANPGPAQSTEDTGAAPRPPQL